MVVYHDRNLIINYIPRNISDIDLTNLFSLVGAIKYCRIIRDRESGSSFGFGFCEYEDSESAIKAINRFNGYRLADKVLKVSMAKLQGRMYHSSNLFVKNLPLTLTEEEISELFSRYGTVVQCRVLRDRDTDVSKGSAYVLMESRNDAEKAKKLLDGTAWPGSTDSEALCIKFATPPYRQPGRDTLNNTKGYVPQTIGKTVEDMCQTDQLAAQMLSLQSKYGALNDPFTAHQLSDGLVYLQQTRDGICGLPQSSVSISPSTNNCGIMWSSDYISPEAKSISTAPVQFAPMISHYFAQQALAPNIWPVQQGGLQPINPAFPTHLDGFTSALHGCPIFTGLPNHLLPLFGMANIVDTRSTVASSMDSYFAKRSKGSRIEKVCTSIYVYNVGNLMTERQLAELFCPFGCITEVSIPKDPKTSFARNFGFVTFTTVQSAQEAIQGMNGASFAGRRLQVSFRKSKNSRSGNSGESSKLYNTTDNDNSLSSGSPEDLHDVDRQHVDSQSNEPVGADPSEVSESFVARLSSINLNGSVNGTESL